MELTKEELDAFNSIKELDIFMMENPNSPIPPELLLRQPYRPINFNLKYDYKEPLPAEIAKTIFIPTSPTYPCDQFFIEIYNQREILRQKDSPLFTSLALTKTFDTLLPTKPHSIDPSLAKYCKETPHLTIKEEILNLFAHFWGYEQPAPPLKTTTPPNPTKERKPSLKEFKNHIEEHYLSQLNTTSFEYECCQRGSPSPNNPRATLDTRIADLQPGIIQESTLNLPEGSRAYRRLVFRM